MTEEFPWAAIGVIVAALTLLGGIGMLALHESLRKKFAPRGQLFDANDRPLFVSKEDNEASMQRIHRRIDENRDHVQGVVSLHASLDDRVGDMEQSVALLDERQRSQWESITKEVANTVQTLQQVTRELRDVSELQRLLLDRMERGGDKPSPRRP